jgi:hypothetical protein
MDARADDRSRRPTTDAFATRVTDDDHEHDDDDDAGHFDGARELRRCDSRQDDDDASTQGRRPSGDQTRERDDGEHQNDGETGNERCDDWRTARGARWMSARGGERSRTPPTTRTFDVRLS